MSSRRRNPPLASLCTPPRFFFFLTRLWFALFCIRIVQLERMNALFSFVGSERVQGRGHITGTSRISKRYHLSPHATW